jgi:hypothetical protein
MAQSSAQTRTLLGFVLAGLGAACLLIHLIGMSVLAYDLFIRRVPVGPDLIARALVLGLVYLFGLGLGSVSQRTLANEYFPVFAQIYVWIYLLLMAGSYLATLVRMNTQDYNSSLIIKFVLILAAELMAIGGLRLTAAVRGTGWHAAPIILMAIVHLFWLAFRYVATPTPVSLYLLGDLFVLFAMTGVGLWLLGESMFRSWSHGD